MALERQIRSKRQRSAVCRQAAAADAEQRPALLAEAEALARSAHRIGSKMRRIRDLYHAAVMRLVVPKDVQRPVVVIPYYHRAARSGLPARTRLLMGALGARVRARTRMTRGWRHGRGGLCVRATGRRSRAHACVCVSVRARVAGRPVARGWPRAPTAAAGQRCAGAAATGPQACRCCSSASAAECCARAVWSSMFPSTTARRQVAAVARSGRRACARSVSWCYALPPPTDGAQWHEAPCAHCSLACPAPHGC